MLENMIELFILKLVSKLKIV